MWTWMIRTWSLLRPLTCLTRTSTVRRVSIPRSITRIPAHPDRVSARRRLERLHGRPQFVCHETTRDAKTSLAATRAYLDSCELESALTFAETGFRNHSDAWVLRPGPARSALRQWLGRVLAGPRDG